MRRGVGEEVVRARGDVNPSTKDTLGAGRFRARSLDIDPVDGLS